MNFFCIFLPKNLHISKISCTFAPDLKNKSNQRVILHTHDYV